MANRRSLLRGIAAASSAGFLSTLAGCSSGNGGSGEETTAGSEATAGESATESGETDVSEGTSAGGPTTGETTGSPSTAAGGGTGGGSGSPTVAVASDPTLGEILVDGEGMTLYLFTEDSAGQSNCSGDCAEAWPPLTVDGEPTAGPDVTAELGTIQRGDGSRQVTAGGTPLYYYAPDSAPGDTTGQGVGDVWYVLAPDGSQISASGTGTGSETAAGTTETTSGQAGISY